MTISINKTTIEIASVILILFLAIGSMIGYKYAMSKIPHGVDNVHVDAVGKPKYKYLIDPNTASMDMLKAMAAHKIDIGYNVDSFENMIISLSVDASDSYKDTMVHWKITTPQIQDKNSIGLNVGMFYDTRIIPFFSPSYGRHIGMVWIVGSAFIGVNGGLYGGMGGVNFTF
jgi:hypothetical protein